MSKKAVITSTIILTIANLITKIMGFYNRIFLSNTIGAEGMGLYQLILPIYGLAWSITSSGFTTTISKLTAQEYIRGKTGNVRRILKQSISLSIGISLLTGILLFFCSKELAVHILKDGRAALPLQLLSFSIPFMAAGSCLRGFFLGMQETIVPAASQVLEQTIRIMTIYLLSGIFVPLGLTYACLAAVAGIFLGECGSCIFTIWNYIHYKKKHKITLKPTISSSTALSLILPIAIPLTASRLSASFLATAENIMIPRQLQLHGQNSSQALATYGELTGMAIPLILLPSACLLAASVSLVPEISEACAVKQKTRISKTIEAAFLFTFIIGFGAASLFAVFPKEICYIIYNRPALGNVLFPLAFLCPLLYAQTTLHGLLNGLGEQLFLFWNNLLSSLISIAVIWFAMPLYGIVAFLVGWLLSLLFSVSTALYLLWKRTYTFPSLYNCFLKPMIAGTGSSLLVKYIIYISEPSKLFFLCSIAAMGGLYFLSLFALGCLKKEELLSLFGTKKTG